MSLIVRFMGGPRAGEAVEFDDTHLRIVIGRDAANCDIVMPADETIVGREHCALERDLGRYELRLNEDNPVRVDGDLAIEGDELGPRAELQLGVDGPRLLLETRHDETLPSTDVQPGQPGQPDLIREVDRAARSGKRTAVIATLLLLVAAVTGYLAWDRAQEEAQETRSDVEDTRSDLARARGDLQQTRENIEQAQQALDETLARVATIEPKITALSDLTDQQEDVLADIVSNVAAVDKRITQIEPRLAESLAKASGSVLLVLRKTEDGQELPEATAWVVDKSRGLLVTNGHVADVFSKGVDSSNLVVRTNSTPARTLEVTGVEHHPGYQEFQQLWYRYDPMRLQSSTGATRINPAGPGCDVALLKVADREALPANLPLATDKELASLAPGYAIGYVGYPMEGIVLGGINPLAPAPTWHMAYITALTSYFGDQGVPFKDRLLIQHALPSAGGASGSPILNRDGKVIAVHNAGNVIGLAPGGRIKSGANIQYGQRVDLVRELLEGKAGDIQKNRSTEWARDIAKYFEPRAKVESEVRAARDRIMAESVSSWRGAQSLLGNYDVTVMEEANRTRFASPRFVYEFRLADAGNYYALAYAPLDNVNLELGVQTTVSGVVRSFVAWHGNANWARAVAFEVENDTDVEAAVGSQPGGGLVKLQVYKAVRTRVPADKKLASERLQWMESLRRNGRSDIVPGLVSEASGQLPEPMTAGRSGVDQVDVEVEDSGEYFVFASTPEDDPVNLTVVRDDEEGLTLLGFYRYDAPSAHVSFVVTSATKLSFFVAGDKKDQRYDLKLFRAVADSSDDKS